MEKDRFMHGVFQQLGLLPAHDNLQKNGFGFTMIPDPDVGTGYLWSYPVNPYFSITIYHLTYYKEIHYCYHHPAMLVISLSSPAVARAVSDQNLNHKEQLLGYYLPDGKYEDTLKVGSVYYNVSITFAPEFYKSRLNQIYERDFSDLPQMAEIMNGSVNIPVVSSIMKDIAEYVPTDAVSELFYEAKALELIAGLIGWHMKRSETASVRSICDSDIEAIHRLNHYIEQHYCECLDIHSLAVMCHMSKSKLSDLYKAVYNTTITEYINDLRIERAKDLLVNSSCQISEVSSILGYEHQSSFTFRFKQTVGMAPREYRKLNR